MSRNSYFSYLVSLVRSSSPYRIWQRGLTYFRRFRLLSIILTISIRIVTIIETSALLITLAAVALVLLPIALVIGIITSIAAIIDGRKKLELLSRKIEDKRVYIFFPKSLSENDSVIFYTKSELAAKGNNLVFTVFPPRINYRGEFFLTAKRLSDGSYCIKRRFFFRLRKILKTHPDNVYLIY